MILKWREKRSGLTLTRAQRSAVYDGNAWSMMVGFGETYLNPFAIFLKGGNLQLSLLTSVPPFLGAIAQVFSLWFIQTVQSRRALIGRSVAVQALVWIPIALLPFFVVDGPTAVWILLALASLAQISAGLGGPAWNSLIGDLIPAEIRGRYFGLRSFSMGFYTFVAVFGGGQLLGLAEKFSLTRWGFFSIFMGAFVARCISYYWLQGYDDLPHEAAAHKHHFTLFDFLRRSPRSNFAKFVFYTSIVNGAVAFSGPFFTLYMLRDLGLSYSEFTLVTVANTIVGFLVMQYWGQISDRFGNKSILNLLGYGVAITPIMWLFGTSIPYLLAIQMFNGIVWAGFNLAAANFLFDAVTPAKRARCTAYQAFVNGSCVLIGACVGGIVVDLLPHELSLAGYSWRPFSALYFMFVISGIVRISAAAIFLSRIQSVGGKRAMKHYELFFQIARLRPASGLSFEVVSSGKQETATPHPPNPPQTLPER